MFLSKINRTCEFHFIYTSNFNSIYQNMFKYTAESTIIFILSEHLIPVVLKLICGISLIQ